MLALSDSSSSFNSGLKISSLPMCSQPCPLRPGSGLLPLRRRTRWQAAGVLLLLSWGHGSAYRDVTQTLVFQVHWACVKFKFSLSCCGWMNWTRVVAHLQLSPLIQVYWRQCPKSNSCSRFCPPPPLPQHRKQHPQPSTTLSTWKSPLHVDTQVDRPLDSTTHPPTPLNRERLRERAPPVKRPSYAGPSHGKLYTSTI